MYDLLKTKQLMTLDGLDALEDTLHALCKKVDTHLLVQLQPSALFVQEVVEELGKASGRERVL